MGNTNSIWYEYSSVGHLPTTEEADLADLRDFVGGPNEARMSEARNIATPSLRVLYHRKCYACRPHRGPSATIRIRKVLLSEEIMEIEWRTDDEAAEICDGDLRRKPLALKHLLISRALDLGGGSGWFSEQLKEAGNLVVTIDLNLSRLSQSTTVEPILGNILYLPFRDNSFDLIFARAILHHVHQNLDLCFNEIKRTLKPKGYILIEEPCYYNPVAYLARKFFPTTIHDPHERPFDPGFLKSEVSKHFEIMEIGYYCLLSYPMPHLIPRLPQPIRPVARRFTRLLYRFDGFLLHFRPFQKFCGYIYILGRFDE